jgi:hypothetical protein
MLSVPVLRLGMLTSSRMTRVSDADKREEMCDISDEDMSNILRF